MIAYKIFINHLTKKSSHTVYASSAKSSIKFITDRPIFFLSQNDFYKKERKSITIWVINIELLCLASILTIIQMNNELSKIFLKNQEYVSLIKYRYFFYI